MRREYRKLFWRALTLSFLVVAVSACAQKEEEDNYVPGKIMSVAVSGNVSYEDRHYSRSGFTGTTSYKSVRYAIVDLVQGNGDVVASTTTDEDGNYVIAGSGGDLYVRVLAATSRAAGTAISVSDYYGNMYAVRRTLDDTMEENESGELSLDFEISYASRIGGAFNVLDVYTNASLFVTTLTTRTLPSLSAYWTPASSRYGTYFCSSNSTSSSCPQGRGVYLLGGYSNGGDTDEYDDDVLYHEYGHYLEATFGVLDSPGGIHYLTDNDSDLRLAWSEGFGGFFPGAVKSWLMQNDAERLSAHSSVAPTYFVDTYGTLAAISIDMNNPSPSFCAWGVDCFVYSSSEVAVAKVLNQLRENFGMQAVWDVYTGYMPSGTSLPATLESFWDGWLQQRAPSDTELGQVHSIFENRLVFYQEDAFEADNEKDSGRNLVVCPTTNCAGEKHYLYHANVTDVDLIAFDAQAGQAYFIETADLSNGADTYIRILNQAGNVMVDANGQTMINNDRPGTVYCYDFDSPCRIHNDEAMLSSSLQFTPAQSDTYYIEVKTSPSKPAAAGRYGTYTLRVMEQ